MKFNLLLALLISYFLDIFPVQHPQRCFGEKSPVFYALKINYWPENLNLLLTVVDQILMLCV